MTVLSTLLGATIAGMTASSTHTMSNKGFDLGTNALSGTSAQLRAAISDEVGTGSLVFSHDGVWTPTAGAQLTVSGTFTPGNCSYTKIGRIVHLFGSFSATSLSCTAGGVLCGGIPFACDASKGTFLGVAMLSFASLPSFGIYVGSSGLQVIGAVPTTTAVYFSASYITAA